MSLEILRFLIFIFSKKFQNFFEKHFTDFYKFLGLFVAIKMSQINSQVLTIEL